MLKPFEQMQKNFAMSFMEIISATNDLPKLKMFALRARTFEDVRMGPYRLPFTENRDFLRMRLYAVDYIQRVYGDASVCLTQVAKGIVLDRCWEYGDLTVLKMHWLSHFPRET